MDSEKTGDSHELRSPSSGGSGDSGATHSAVRWHSDADEAKNEHRQEQAQMQTTQQQAHASPRRSPLSPRATAHLAEAGPPTMAAHSGLVRLRRQLHSRRTDLLRAALQLLMLGLIYLTALTVATATTASGALMLPGGALFSLGLLLILGVLAGEATQRWLRLPALLGMLLAGIIVANIPGWSLARDIPTAWARVLKSAALAVILLRAGVGLDTQAVRALGLPTFALTILPGTMEALVVGLLSAACLGLPPTWAAMMGFLLAGVSPAVVVPSLLLLNEQGYGVKEGISSMLLAAAGFDTVVAITMFGICFGMTFASDTGASTLKYLHAPIEISLGLAGGFVIGYAIAAAWTSTQWMAREDASKAVASRPATAQVGANAVAPLSAAPAASPPPPPSPESPLTLTCILLFASIVCVLGTSVLDYAGAGPLAVIVLGATVAHYLTPLPPPPRTDERPAEAEQRRRRNSLQAGVLASHLLDAECEEQPLSPSPPALAAPSAASPPSPAPLFRNPHRLFSSSSPTLLPAVSSHLKLVWGSVGQVVLFALLGTAVRLGSIDPALLGWSIIIIAGGLAIRCVAAYVAAGLPRSSKAHTTNNRDDVAVATAQAPPQCLSRTERLFVAVSWLPKATVQAALSSAALDEVHRRQLDGGADETRARQLLTVAVLAILITAPPSAVLISKLGPRWLKKNGVAPTHSSKPAKREGSDSEPALTEAQVDV